MCLVLLHYVVFLILTCFLTLHSAANCAQPDYTALSSFYSNISPVLDWTRSDNCCDWEGILCDDVTGRVTQILLPNKGLNGTISPSLGKITHLSVLDLSKNRFFGTLFVEFFLQLSNLELVNLSSNGLSGEFPVLGNDNIIQSIDVSSNRFRGEIPIEFFKFGWNLTTFLANNNSFSGSIPSPICDGLNPNSSRFVKVLDFSNNNLNGSLPLGLGNCSQLIIFRAGFNSLTGGIPKDLYSARSLEEISLHLNQLSGPIGDGVTNLSNLKTLALYSNNFSGSIPANIGRLSKLEELLLYINNLTETLPQSLRQCANLRKLILRVNKLDGNITDYDFSPLQKLTTVDLGNNLFTGTLPRSLYKCQSLTAIRFSTNKLMGELSSDIIALKSLSFISISNNSFTNISGAIRILMQLKNLTTILLSKNFFGESMPTGNSMVELDGFQNVQVLALGGCQLVGEVPTWLRNLKNLEALDLSQNRLTGPLPGWLSSLPDLFYVDLSTNNFTGEFPVKFTRFPALTSGQPVKIVNQTYLELPVFAMPNNATNQQYNQLSSLPPAIYLANNNLSGVIPSEIGQLKSLHQLDLNNNNLSGSIPDEIGGLTNLEFLILSHNHLTGGIPVSLKFLSFLSSFTVAFNNLQGPIPTGGQFDTFPNTSFIGNPGLCGEVLMVSCSKQPGDNHPRRVHKNTNKALIVGLILGICLVAALIFVFAVWILSKRRILPRRESDKTEMDTFSSNSNLGIAPDFDNDTSLVMVFHENANEMKDLTISEILAATDNFNQANIIGCGAFGLVYKATLDDGKKLAVKKLSGDLGLMEKEFKAEVEVLSNARHENLVALQGYCIHEGSRLLMYSFMENGSLDYWLHEKSDGPSQLDWPTRLKIAQGASRGLAYMHQICDPHIVHRDIKSSNILLDDKFEAHVADFGLSRLILPYHTHVTTELVGTLGYIPPEYAHAWIATLRGDMYSFGVVMLELLTGKRPVEVSKPKESRELVAWVQEMRKMGKQDEIFDSLLRGKGFEDQMLQVLDVACQCVSTNPFKRPSILEVVDWLKNVGLNSPMPK